MVQADGSRGAPYQQTPGEKQMRKTSFIALSTVAIALAGCSKPDSATTSSVIETATATPADRYLPEYTASGELVLPKNFERWVYMGSPLTPNALNNGKANFPEYHNVYIQPWAYDEYKKTGVFPEGTIMFKELQLTLKGKYPDGSRDETSGRGYFPGKLNGADVSVKDSKRYSDTQNWGYYNFNHGEPKFATAKLRPIGECAQCHIDGAKKDMVWTQFYPRLDS